MACSGTITIPSFPTTGGGGPGTIEVQENGLTIESTTDTINFVGDWIITNPSAGTVDVKRGNIVTDVLSTVVVDANGDVVRSFI